ncbi:metallophosphoesterase [Portibacter lacus]|uniref:Metallophosphoesterase n=1 Tax=Portibacter lacus TaxID=1099794 RepID=A0AA37SIY8_9BACT|nr:metallophosphoesterase [Portibacter lacus]GLR15518.1 metallophosphoesterase [Portibacter lacus]
MNRRKFIYNSAGILAIPLLTGVYSWQMEPFWLEFVHKKMDIKNLPSKLQGKTLMQISDMHVGDRFPREYLMKSLEKAKVHEPDIVVYTGDYITYDSDEQFNQLEEVVKHTLKGKMGTFGIFGNHDYGENWSNAEVAHTINGILERAGIQVLRNEYVEVEELGIIGIDDFWGTNYNPTEVLRKVKNENGKIILCHNPDVADEAIWENINGWILSGHTHGGQVDPPFLEPPMLPVKNKNYSAGEIELNPNLSMYINRALGHLWQVRFNVRPEITIFTLNKK